MVQASGAKHVGLLRRVNKEFENLEDQWLGRLKRHFRNFGLPGAMPPEHFKVEGRFPTGGARSINLQICAFKAFQIRIYGPVIPIDGVATFAGLEMITDKKTDRADQELLRRVARKFEPYV